MSTAISHYECGSFHDNVALFDRARSNFARGRFKGCRLMCERLRQHIDRSSDQRSTRLLLPRVNEMLAAVDKQRRSQARRSVNPSSPRQPDAGLQAIA